MRKMTFVSFLEYYLSDVSGQSSLSIHKLFKLYKKNFRILDSLILYALFTDKMHILYKYIDDSKKHLLIGLTKDNFLEDKYDYFEFKKIYQSYIRKINKHEYRNITKQMSRKHILSFMAEKNISNYRIYTDLSLNPGNINDYLTNGNVHKVSLSLVEKIFRYCRDY